MKIHFFTAEFPYLKSETFIENELPIIAKNSEDVQIYPYNIKGETSHRSIPKNAKIHLVENNEKKIGFGNYLLIFRILFTEFFLSNNKGYFLKKLRTWVSLLKKAIQTSEELPISEENKKDCFYSYWMNDWVTVLLILKLKGRIDNFVFRCGGFDIWDERHEGGYLPFRGIIYKHTSGVFPNSYKAEVYLKNKRLSPEKIEHKYWGTKDLGVCNMDIDQKFTIVSCSNVIPLKRVHLIIEILEHLNFPIKWIHFGDGSEFDEIKNKARQIQDKHEVEFRGRTSNKEVLDFYLNNSVNLFVTTSSTEGLPVSIQEAISFGIPILATNVGGMAEVVTDETGILIPADFQIVDTAKLIEEFKNSDKNSLEFRKGVRNFWLERFEAEKVYTAFYSFLKSKFQD